MPDATSRIISLHKISYCVTFVTAVMVSLSALSSAIVAVQLMVPAFVVTKDGKLMFVAPFLPTGADTLTVWL
jgi:hypothetical protein